MSICMSAPKALRVFLATLCLLFSCAAAAHAHRPHDDVQHLAFVSLPEGGNAGLAVVRNTLFRSRDPAGPWKRVTRGLTNRYGFTSILESPAQPGTVYLSADQDGVFGSQDGGLTWRKMDRGLGAADVALLAAGPAGQVLAADGAGGLWHYDPGTGIWTASARLETKASAAHFLSEAEVLVGTEAGAVLRLDPRDATVAPVWSGPPDRAITALAAPQSGAGDVILVGTAGSGVFRSGDGGASFGPVLAPESEENVTDIAFAPGPAGPGSLAVVTTWTSVFVSTDAGRSFALSEQGLHRSSQADTEKYRSPHFRSVSIVGTDAEAPLLAVGGFSGLFLSSDLGGLWREADTLPADIVMAFAVSAPDADGQHAIAIGSYGDGVALSEDEGATWRILHEGLPDMRIRDVAFSAHFWKDGLVLSATKAAVLHARRPGFDWQSTSLRNQGLFSAVLSVIRPPIERMMRANETFSNLMNKYSPRPKAELTIHPGVVSVTADGQVYVGTAVNGLFHAEEIGGRFERIKAPAKAEISALGIVPAAGKAARIYVGDGAFVEPPDPSAVPSLSVSDDGGKTWNRIPVDLPVNGRLRAAVAETATGTLVAAGSGSGLILSRDGGGHWHRPETPQAVREGTVSEVALSPDVAADGTILVSIKGQGLYRSTDGGETFSPVGADLAEEGLSLSHLVSFPATSPAIRFSPAYRENGVIFGSTGTAIMRSADRGQTWETLPFPPLESHHH